MNNKLIIRKLNCANGIKGLKIDKEPLVLENAAIYSSNGCFKTSFTNAIYKIKNGIAVEDRISHEKCEWDINIEDTRIDKSDVPVITFSRELLENHLLATDFNLELSKLCLNEKSVTKLNNIMKRQREVKESVNRIIRNNKIDKAFNSVFIDFNNYDIKTFIVFFNEMNDVQVDNIENMANKYINAKKVQDTLKNPEFINKLNKYQNVLVKEKENTFFDENMNMIQFEKFMKILKSMNFFDINHKCKIVIYDKEYDNYEDLNVKYEEEKRKIIDSPEAKEAFDEIEKGLGTAGPAKDFKSEIQNNNESLNLYANGLKNILYQIIKDKIDLNIESIIREFENYQTELEEIANASLSEKTRFDKAIDIFEERFNPVFDIKIENKEKSNLGIELPEISFCHHTHEDFTQTEEEISEILSSGEKTTLNIIKFIVEYEMVSDKEPIIILDDIVETFDYGNRYAFLEYISDLKKNKCNVILLTHNFEFFRTVTLKKEFLSIKTAYKKNDGLIKIENAKPLFFQANLIIKSKQIEPLIASIPFCREISQFKKEKVNLNSFLHYDNQTENKTIEDLISSTKNVIDTEYTGDKKMNYMEALFKAAGEIKGKGNVIDIKNKIILAIACRIKCDKLMINGDFNKLEGIDANESRMLYDRNKDEFTEKFREICHDVLIVAPDYIHLNGFMYEPLVDIPLQKLKNLYSELENIVETEVYKS